MGRFHLSEKTNSLQGSGSPAAGPKTRPSLNGAMAARHFLHVVAKFFTSIKQSNDRRYAP
jgi:hypothetical protein